MIQPIYTAANCTPAFQIRWSLVLFARSELPPVESWLQDLQGLIELDGIRLLEQRFKPRNVWFFLLCTTPRTAPPAIVKSVKGRLQNQIRCEVPKAFRRNFCVTSVGDVGREIVEGYVSRQLSHHRMADPRIQHRLEEFLCSFPEVDLSKPIRSNHGQYIYNLHLVVVHRERWRETRAKRLKNIRDMILSVAQKKGQRISKASVSPDHVHITLGFNCGESPEGVALGYLNNLAFVHGMKDVFCPGYYVGTFGEYDMGAIWNAL